MLDRGWPGRAAMPMKFTWYGSVHLYAGSSCHRELGFGVVDGEVYLDPEEAQRYHVLTDEGVVRGEDGREWSRVIDDSVTTQVRRAWGSCLVAENERLRGEPLGGSRSIRGVTEEG